MFNLKLPDNNLPVYTGTVSTDGFQLGQFIDNNNIGNIAFRGKINGSGFTAASVNMNFDGNVSRFVFNTYEYKDISLKGDFKRKLFTGAASIHDPNLKLDTLIGTIDLAGKEPQFDFAATLANANLKQLKLINDDYELSGRFNLNFVGSNIDNFIGTCFG